MASIAELYLEQGRRQGEYARRRGEVSAQLYGQLANILGTTVENVVREREEAPIRKMRRDELQAQHDARVQAAEDKSILQSAQSSDLDPDAIEGQLKQSGRGDLAQQFRASWMASEQAAGNIKKLRNDLQVAEREYFGSLAAGVKPYLDDEDGGLSAARLALQKAKRDGYEDADAWLEQITANPGSLRDMVTGLLQASPNYAKLLEPPKTREVRTRGADGSEQVQIVEDTPGQTFTSAPEAARPDARPLATQLADAIRTGDQAAANSIRQAIREAERLGRAPDKPEDPLARRERELRIAKMEADLAKATSGSSNEKLDAIRPVLSEITALSRRIFTTEGPAANVAGGFRALLAKANMDDDVRVYKSLVRGMTPLLARAVGHTGVLTEQDVNRTEELFPTITVFGGTDDASVASRKIEQFERMMAGHGSEQEKADVRSFMGWSSGGASAPPRGRGPGPVGQASDPLGIR